jgi:Ca2+-binding RTX toxin-like protein
MANSGSPGTSVTGGSFLPYRPPASGFVGTAGPDTIAALSADDVVRGHAGADRLLGGAGDDLISGDAGADLLRGQAGDDRLDGGAGRDVLVGGRGDDVFVFGFADSAPGSADVIRGGDGAPAFEGAGRAGGDRIDLSGIDADTTRAGDQAFDFGGGAAGQVVVRESRGLSVVCANTDDDPAFEFALVIADGAVRASAYGAADFIL